MHHHFQGLTHEEARARLAKEGYNELPSQKRKDWLQLLWTVLREPMILLLVAAGLVYLVLGEPKDTIMLGATVLVVVMITFFQERRTERTLEALRSIASPRALVIRGGEAVKIPGREVVTDDIILLREGDRIPADAFILEEENLLVDESLLTGESRPVRKSVWEKKEFVCKPGGELLPCVFSGTLIVGGRGKAVVRRIGIATEMGKIGTSLETIKEEDSLLHRETQHIVRVFASAGLLLCVAVVVLYGLRQGSWLHGLLSGLTLAMAILPEEFPVILLIFLTLGAWRISKRHVLARRSAVIETLGAATVLCVDKTGTITENRMSLDVVYADGLLVSTKGDLSTHAKHVLRLGLLASQKDPFDPIEKELARMGRSVLAQSEHLREGLELLKTYPISKDVVAVTHVYRQSGKRALLVACKGAPEAILELCHADAGTRKHLLHTVETLAKDGLRVLGVAQAEWDAPELPESPRAFRFELKGLLGFIDPIREAVPHSIQVAKAAGIRTIMITGDYPGTAVYVAERAGLPNPTLYLTGDDLESMPLSELQKKMSDVHLFARVVPEQKLRIIEALKANGEIVAMTGDGVNDAPALKAAHIGISMGMRGTDVAREASALVLLNDDFSSIVSAVRLGRRIFDNIKRAMRYVLAVHIPIIGVSFLPVALGFPPILFPAHIAFLEFIIDPTCSIVFETIEEDTHIMKRKPRNLHEPLLNRRVFAVGMLQGLSVFALLFGLNAWLLYTGRDVEVIRAMMFYALVISNLILIVMNLSWSEHVFTALSTPNKTLWLVVGGALAGMAGLQLAPPLRSLFSMGAISVVDALLLLLLSGLLLVWLEVLKTGWAWLIARKSGFFTR